ncbi:unnamed protein product, partial [Meganyctiphanes norvegica]
VVVLYFCTVTYCNPAYGVEPTGTNGLPLCPFYDPNLHCALYNEQCKSDKDCGYGEYCCTDINCGSYCVTRKHETRMRCPISPPVMCVWFNEQCKGDQDCAYGEWCCGDSCGTACKKPEHRDVCPSGDGWNGCPFGQDECITDADCDRTSCCPYGGNGACGSICM